MSVSGGGESRDYVGPYEYLRGSLLAVRHEEGRAVVLGASYQYEYFCTDHLVNVRVVLRDSAGVAQASQYTDYDPWGLVLRGISGGASSNRQQFTGQETVSELGSGLVDLGARGYDAQIGRFGVVDPLAELGSSWSGYRYGYDNPVLMTDPGGMLESVATGPGCDTNPTACFTPGQEIRRSSGGGGSSGNAPSTENSMAGVFSYRQEEPIKGGGFPRGDLRPDWVTQPVFRSAGTHLHRTEEEEAGISGVRLGLELVGSEISGFALAKWLKGTFSGIVNKFSVNRVVLNPNEIYFMQSSIRNTTGDFTVLGNAEALSTGTLNPNVLRMSVWKDASGKIWTLDHRRLAAFRLSGLKEAPVQWANPTGQMWKMTTKNGGTSIRLKLGDGQSVIVK